MADFCNQCAKALGFPEGDFARPNMSPPEEGMGYPELCEGCGPCYVDEKGNCNDPHCDQKHGVKAKAAEILARFKADYERLKPASMLLLAKDIAEELCGEHYDYTITQLHDEVTVIVKAKVKS